MKILMSMLFLFSFGFAKTAQAECADNLEELHEMMGEGFKLDWRETTANDGKPMMLNITEKGGKLHLVFDKTNEGVWGSGEIKICKNGSSYSIVASDMQPGKKTPFLLKGAMSGNKTFNLEIPSHNNIKVSGGGWKGTFEEAN